MKKLMLLIVGISFISLASLQAGEGCGGCKGGDKKEEKKEEKKP